MEELRGKLHNSTPFFAATLQQLVRQSIPAQEAKVVGLPSNPIRLNKKQGTAVYSVLKSLWRNQYSPDETGIDPEPPDWLMEQRRVAKVAQGIASGTSASDERAEGITSHSRYPRTEPVALYRSSFA